jgi:hypothetical protein
METLDLYLNIIRLIVEVVLLVIGIMIVFGKSYISEKAKNLATKEDIAEITGKVEAVKAELQYGAKVKQSVYEESKTAVILAYEALSVWYRQAVRMHWKVSPNFTEDDCDTLFDQISNLGDEFTAAEAKVQLYIGKGAIYNAFEKAATEVSNLFSEGHHYLTLNIQFSEGIQHYEETIERVVDKKIIKEAEDALALKRSNKRFRLKEVEDKLKAYDQAFAMADEELCIEINKLIANPEYLTQNFKESAQG